MVTLPLFPSSALPISLSPRVTEVGPGLAAEQRGRIGQLAAAYGVGSRSDKTEENASMFARQAAQCPPDRLLPMPTVIHPDWTADEVEQVRTLSERLAAAEGNTTLANGWRLRLTTARGRYWMTMEARTRVTENAERHAAIRDGKEVEAGLTFRDAPVPLPSRQAAPGAAADRSSRPTPPLPLGAKMRAGYSTVSVVWGHANTKPPGGLPREVWAFSMPATEDFREIVRDCAPSFAPGSGWCLGVSVQKPQRSKWSEEAKGRVRRRNLQTRLDRKVPLFATLWFQEEVARRPDYFAGKPFTALAQSGEAPMPEDRQEKGFLIGHNGGPPLDPT